MGNLSKSALVFVFVSHGLGLMAQQAVNGRQSLVFENSKAQLVVDLAGGAVGDFHLKDQPLNPLHWATPTPGDTSIRGFGHFLCLDRWGPPSEAEGRKGMPYHGEATHVTWQVESKTPGHEGLSEARMTAKLPLAGLSVRRSIHLSDADSIALVREEITNDNPLGRIYNAVQHPTIGPPFLDETTVVDCNGRQGFAQDGALPYPESPSFFWPTALNRDGETINMRFLKSDPNPNVVSYAIEEVHGWITATTPDKGFLIGYIWKTSDYPWVSLWRDVQDGKPSARGLEFGSTGLHQPFPALVKKGRIWDRPLFEHLDSGETVTKSYSIFLLKVPSDFGGVESVKYEGTRLVVRERRANQPREMALDASGAIP